jgi:hypothetical protein
MDYLQGMRNAPPVLRMGIPFDMRNTGGVTGRGWGISRAGAGPGEPQNARKKQKRKNTCALHKLKLTY